MGPLTWLKELGHRSLSTDCKDDLLGRLSLVCAILHVCKINLKLKIAHISSHFDILTYFDTRPANAKKKESISQLKSQLFSEFITN